MIDFYLHKSLGYSQRTKISISVTGKNEYFLRKRVPFSYASSETSHFSKYGKEGKRMEWELEIKDGGTYYEVSTSCGGSERLRDKMIRLIKSETVKPPNDKQG